MTNTLGQQHVHLDDQNVHIQRNTSIFRVGVSYVNNFGLQQVVNANLEALTRGTAGYVLSYRTSVFSTGFVGWHESNDNGAIKPDADICNPYETHSLRIKAVSMANGSVDILRSTSMLKTLLGSGLVCHVGSGRIERCAPITRHTTCPHCNYQQCPDNEHWMRAHNIIHNATPVNHPDPEYRSLLGAPSVTTPAMAIGFGVQMQMMFGLVLGPELTLSMKQSIADAIDMYGKLNINTGGVSLDEFMKSVCSK